MKQLKIISDTRIQEVKKYKDQGLSDKQICNLVNINERLLKYILEEINQQKKDKKK